MRRDSSFLYLTTADFLVRAAYQMGKTPLLPIFAAALGATDAFLGIIVSVSTFTGMVLKPLIGVLSDRWGRRNWLIMGTLFFIAVPFFYRFIQTPQQLFVIRIIHGLATAIYGPVTLALVLEQAGAHPAERLGWFGMARSAGYIVGPAAAGWMLLTMEPATIFTIIGLISCLALLPILSLPNTSVPLSGRRPSLLDQIRKSLAASGRTPAIWLAGGLESFTYVALYAIRAFLPIYALAIGVNVAVVGTFFALQEATHMILKPAGGRLGDRIGHLPAITVGMVLLGFALALLSSMGSNAGLLILSLGFGGAQALIFPSTTALVSKRLDATTLGAGMGLMGTLRNAGKVIGPALGGLLIGLLDYTATFHILAAAVVGGAIMLSFWMVHLRLSRRDRRSELSHSGHDLR